MDRKIGYTIGACFVTLILMSACDPIGKATEPFKDAPRGSSNTEPADVINMPDGFSNIATKCVDGIRYSVLYHNDNPYGSVSTVVDPNC